MHKTEAKRILMEELSWPEWMVELGVRASFRCEYCDKYMLEDVDVYDSWQVDHIVPDGDNDMSNLALACKMCNFMKRHSNPGDRTEKSDRESLIEAAKKIVADRIG